MSQLAYNPVFVFAFLTAFLWAGAISWFCYKKAEKGGRAAMPARIGMVVFGILAMQSAFWFIGCFVWVQHEYAPEFTFASAFHSLFGSWGVIWWISSLLGLICGLAAEIIDERRRNNGFALGIAVAVVTTFGFLLASKLVLALIGLVNSVVNFG